MIRPTATGYNEWGDEEYVAVPQFSRNTYEELKKEIRKLLFNKKCSYVFVTRSRRGEWGEWFERWMKDGNRIVKYKQGWM